MHERDIFLEALEQHSPDERDSFLDRTCAGDAQLRSRVEVLLTAHEEANSLLDHPVLGGAPTEVLAGRTDRSKLPPFEYDEIVLDFLEPSDQPDALGRLGQYDVREVVGHGGMGIVFKAYDTKLGRVVAVKVLAATLAVNATARKRFLREARAAAAVSHDHVVTVYAVEENEPRTDSPHATRGGPPYLVMEFIDGQSLERKIDREGHLELKEILHWPAGGGGTGSGPPTGAYSSRYQAVEYPAAKQRGAGEDHGFRTGPHRRRRGHHTHR